MEGAIHHLPDGEAGVVPDATPEPEREPAKWKELFLRAMGEDAVAKWGKQLMRITNDLVVICDEHCHIVYHNRGFLRAIGHQEGSYVNQDFLSFFPSADRPEAGKALEALVTSQQGGLRFGATLLTRRGQRPFDARVVRSRLPNGQFLFYMILREEQKKTPDVQRTERQASELLFAGLPVAAFRTDKRLRILRAFGSLWDEWKIDPTGLKGADLSDPQCHLVPQFLHQIDYCDTMAGLTLHADLSWRQVPYEITVEPFLDKNRRVIGTIGMLRKAKTDPVHRGAGHLSIPMPVDPTTPLKHTRTVELSPAANRPVTPATQPLAAPPAAAGQSAAPLGASVVTEDVVSQIRSEIKPRRLSPPDIGCAASAETERVALAN